MRRHLSLACLLAGAATTTHAADNERFVFTQAERIEYQEDSNKRLWDLQGWYGSDYHKLWWKTEGKRTGETDDQSEIQLLYSRATGAFYDLQFGLRVADHNGNRQTSLAIGIQGDAPYRIEYDTAAFVSTDGDILLRAEFERDFLLTQQLVVQPRLEAEASFHNIPERDIEAGLNEIDVGLRLRYEFTRKFAPYIGIEWSRNYVSDNSESSLIAGLRFWF